MRAAYGSVEVFFARLNIGKRPDLGDEETAWARAA